MKWVGCGNKPAAPRPDFRIEYRAVLMRLTRRDLLYIPAARPAPHLKRGRFRERAHKTPFACTIVQRRKMRWHAQPLFPPYQSLICWTHSWKVYQVYERNPHVGNYCGLCSVPSQGIFIVAL